MHLNKCIEFTYIIFLFSLSSLKCSVKFWSEEPISHTHTSYCVNLGPFFVNFQVQPLMVLPLDSFHSWFYLCIILWCLYPSTASRCPIPANFFWDILSHEPEILPSIHLFNHLFTHFLVSTVIKCLKCTW